MKLEFTKEEYRQLLEELERWKNGDESGAIHIALFIKEKLKK